MFINPQNIAERKIRSEEQTLSVGESQKDTYLITASIAELGLVQTSSVAESFFTLQMELLFVR